MLEDHDFDSLRSLCERILDEEAECTEAYEFLLYCDFEKNYNELLELPENVKFNSNFQKVIKFGDDENDAKFYKLSEAYDAYIKIINEEKKLKRQKEIERINLEKYNSIKQEYNKLKSIIYVSYSDVLLLTTKVPSLIEEFKTIPTVE